MKRKIFSVLFALVLVLSFSLVTAVPVGAIDPAVLDRTTAITTTADRLVALQSTETLGALDPPDYGWDWKVTDATEHSGSSSSSNLYGVTALGLIDANEVTGDPSYLDAAGLVAEMMIAFGIDYQAFYDYGDMGLGYSFDLRFLMSYAEASDNIAYSDFAKGYWAWVKARELTPPAVNVYADGNQEQFYQIYVQYYGDGFAAWGAGDFGLAALAMGDTVWASAMADVLAGHLVEIANEDECRFIGWGKALEFLNAVDSTLYATEIDTLITNLTESQNDDGSWGTGENTEGIAQDAAYAIIGLVAVGGADAIAAAEKGADWLVANQGYDTIAGGWNDSTDNIEFSETDSEALQALASVSAPVTIVDKGYYSIQSAINSASPEETITVAAGNYDPFTVDGKTGLTIEAVGDVTVEGALLDVLVSYKSPADLVVFVNNSTNITLDGLDIQGAGISGTSYAVLYQASTGTIRECQVSPNTVGNMYSLAIAIISTLERDSDVTIDGCEIENFGRVGIYVRGTATISGGFVEGQVYTGEDEVCYGVEVEQVLDAEGATRGSLVTIDGTEIYNCDNSFVTGPTWDSSGVYINGWLEHKPQGQADSTVIVEHCNIHDNYIGIIVIKSSLSSAHFNNIYDNRDCGVDSIAAYDATTAVFDATNNYWGNASGPTHATTNPFGIGDAVSDFVTYNPWLLEAGGDPYDKTLALKDDWTLVSVDKAVAEAIWVGTNPLVVELLDETMAYKYTYQIVDDVLTGGFVFATPADLEPLTALYVLTKGGGGVGFKYAEDGDPAFYSKDLEAGWNLIGIPSTIAGTDDILSPLRYVTAGTQQVVGLTTLVSQGEYNQFSVSFYDATLTEADWGALSSLDPFDGYWANMEAADTFEVPSP